MSNDFKTPRVTHYYIYNHPKDYPNHFVVREFDIYPNLVVPGECKLANSLDEARNLIPPEMELLHPDPIDDPVIEEIWI